MTQPNEQIESFGSYLRREREMREIPLEEIAAYTRIKLKALQAIEDDDLAALPPLAFVRAFIRCYADYIGLNLGEVMLRFDSFIQNQFPEMTGEVQILPQRSRPRQRHLPLIFAAVFVVIVIFTWWINRTPAAPGSSTPTPPEAEQPELQPGGSLPPTDVILSGSPATAPTRPETPEPPPETPSPPPTTQPPETPPPRENHGRTAARPIRTGAPWTSRYSKPLGPPLKLATFPTTETGETDLPPLPQVRHRLVIQAKDNCWLRYQVDYDSAHNALLKPNDEFYGEAANRIRVQIGRPEAIENITYNDQPIQYHCTAMPCCLAFPAVEDDNCPEQAPQ